MFIRDYSVLNLFLAQGKFMLEVRGGKTISKVIGVFFLSPYKLLMENYLPLTTIKSIGFKLII